MEKKSERMEKYWNEARTQSKYWERSNENVDK